MKPVERTLETDMLFSIEQFIEQFTQQQATSLNTEHKTIKTLTGSSKWEVRNGKFEMESLAVTQEQMAAQTSGSFSVRNEGSYVARFNINYDYEGSFFSKSSGNFTAGTDKSIDIPEGASNITLTVEEAWFINSWSTILTANFSSAVKKRYKIWGTTLSPAWEEINYCDTAHNSMS